MYQLNQKIWVGITMVILGLSSALAKQITNESEAPNKQFVVIKNCVSEDSCQYAIAKDKKGSKPTVVLRNMPNGQIEWLGNIASFDYGGCGTSCFNQVFIHPTGATDMVNNPVFIDEKTVCVIYPTAKSLVVRQLFNQNTLQHYVWTDKSFSKVKSPAFLGLIEAQKANNGDVVLRFDDEKGQERSVRLTRPCLKK